MGQINEFRKAFDTKKITTFERLEEYKTEFVDAKAYAMAVRNELKAQNSYKMEFMTVKEFSSKLSVDDDEKRKAIQVEIETLRLLNR